MHNNLFKLKLKLLTPVLILLLIFSGCVSKKKFSDVQSERESLQENLDQCRQRVTSLEDQIETLGALEDENEELKQQLAAAKNRVDELSEQLKNRPRPMNEGVVFRVQIGAFKERDLPQDLDESDNLEISQEGDLERIVVGQFRDYQKADKLKKELREIGVETAWIVPYKDGQRVKLSEVLDQAIDQQQ